MGSLASMFPAYDRAVLEMLLSDNGGRLEATIEQLLAMEGPAGGGAPSGSSAPAPSSAASPPSTPAWRHPLPPDFLVLPPAVTGRFTGLPQNSIDSQLLADQQLAEMLQSAYTCCLAVPPGLERARPPSIPPSPPPPPPS